MNEWELSWEQARDNIIKEQDAKDDVNALINILCQICDISKNDVEWNEHGYLNTDNITCYLNGEDFGVKELMDKLENKYNN